MTKNVLNDRKMMSLNDARLVKVYINDLDDVIAYRKPTTIPSDFLENHDEEIRVAAWIAAMDFAEGAIRAKLRELGVDA